MELCKTRLPQNMGIPPEQIQVLTPTRKRGAGSAALNRALQQALNPPADDKGERALLVSSGATPRFTPWAFMTMALSRACRKISVRDTAGTTPGRVRRARIFPGPCLFYLSRAAADPSRSSCWCVSVELHSTTE